MPCIMLLPRKPPIEKQVSAWSVRYFRKIRNENSDRAHPNPINVQGEEGNGGRDPQHDLNDDTIVYVYDDYVDDYYAYKEDTDPYKLLPLTTDKVVGFMLAAMGLTLAAGGGIGGENLFTGPLAAHLFHVLVYCYLLKYHPFCVVQNRWRNRCSHLSASFRLTPKARHSTWSCQCVWSRCSIDITQRTSTTPSG